MSKKIYKIVKLILKSLLNKYTSFTIFKMSQNRACLNVRVSNLKWILLLFKLIKKKLLITKCPYSANLTLAIKKNLPTISNRT